VGSLQRSTHSNLFRFSRMIYYAIRPRGALCNAAISMSVHPSVCPMPLAQKGSFYGYGYYGTLLENPTLEVKPTGRRGLNGSISFRCHQGDTLFINLFQTGGWAKREGKGGVSKGRILGKTTNVHAGFYTCYKLPLSIRSLNSFNSFKSHLETRLFARN